MDLITEQILERIWQLKESCVTPDAKWFADMLIRDIEKGNRFDKPFIEIEKDIRKKEVVDFVMWLDESNDPYFRKGCEKLYNDKIQQTK